MSPAALIASNKDGNDSTLVTVGNWVDRSKVLLNLEIKANFAQVRAGHWESKFCLHFQTRVVSVGRLWLHRHG